MKPADVLHFAIMPALQILPPQMTSRRAVAMLLAIGLQESRFEHRRQIQNGPARGLWQFERSGVRGVLAHFASRDHADAVAARLGYQKESADYLQLAIQHNDVLAAAFARLLLWTVVAPLPGPEDAEEGWRQYIEAWRPGKPHPATFPAFYRQAWEMAA